MEGDQKIVYFNLYCSSCKYKNIDECLEPCHDCLNNPTNTDTHRPVNYKKDDKK